MEFTIAVLAFGPVFALCAAGMLAMLPEKEIAALSAETPRMFRPFWQLAKFLK